MTRRARVAVEAVVSIAVLALLFVWSDPGEIWRSLRSAHAGWFLAAIVVGTATVPAMAWRWQRLLAAKRVHVPLGWLTRTYFVALFAGQFLPAAIGGDAVRAVELGRRTGDGPEAVASVLIDRLVGLVALILLALSALALSRSGGAAVAAAEAALGVGALGALALLFSPRMRGLVARVLEPRIDDRRIAAGTRFYEALHGYRDARGTLAAVLVVAMAVQLVRVGVMWLLARSLSLEVSMAQLLVAGPVLFAALVLPVSLNGIGVREAVFVYFLRDADTPSAQAIALGLAFFVAGSATALVGAGILGLRFARYGMQGARPRREIEAPPGS